MVGKKKGRRPIFQGPRQHKINHRDQNFMKTNYCFLGVFTRNCSAKQSTPKAESIRKGAVKEPVEASRAPATVELTEAGSIMVLEML